LIRVNVPRPIDWFEIAVKTMWPGTMFTEELKKGVVRNAFNRPLQPMIGAGHWRGGLADFIAFVQPAGKYVP
jgi:hypothetical protein